MQGSKSRLETLARAGPIADKKSLATGVAQVKRFLKTNNKFYENKSAITLDIVKSRV